MPDSDVTVTASFKEAHVYGKPVWMWGDNYSSAAVKFSCADCGEELLREHTVIEKRTPDPTDPTDPDKGLCKYCGQDHSGSFRQRIVGFFHAILYFILHLFGKI